MFRSQTHIFSLLQPHMYVLTLHSHHTCLSCIHSLVLPFPPFPPPSPSLGFPSPPAHCQALRFKKAHVTHPELKATFCLPVIGVKKNPQSPLYTQLGVITKGTVIEVNISELGLVTQGGKVVWGESGGMVHARGVVLQFDGHVCTLSMV